MNKNKNSVTDETNELVEEQGRLFAADVKPIMDAYGAECRKLSAERNAAIEKSERIKREALEKYEPAIRALAPPVIEKVRQAAKARAAKAQRPENIMQACERYLNPLVYGNGGYLLPEEIIRFLEQQEEWRRSSEEATRHSEWRRTIRYRTLKPWQIP